MSEANQVKNIKTGTVIKIVDEKTVKVEVQERRAHQTYKKVITRKQRFLTQNDIESVKIGQTVEMVPCRKVSKNKSWRIKSIVNKG